MKRALLIALVLLFVVGVAGPAAAREFDLEGRTIRIAGFVHDITPFASRGAETFADPHGRLAAHVQEVEERFNVTLEFVHHTTHARIMEDVPPGVIAGETDADIYMIRREEMIQLASDGFLWPLDDFLGGNYRDRLPAMFRSMDYTDFQGQTYLIPVFEFPPTAIGVLWNMDLFEEMGLPNLYELVEAGEWTWDAMREIALRGVVDRTGDGEIDLWGISDASGNYGTNQSGSAITELALTNDAHWVTEEDGRVVLAYEDPAFYEAVDFVVSLKRDQGTPDLSGTGQYNAFAQGNFLMNMNALRALDWPALRNADFRVGAVPLPMGPRATEYVYPDWSIWGVGIPISVPQPEIITELILHLYVVTSDYKDIDEWQQNFFDNQVANWVHDRESYDILKESMEQAQTASPYFTVINTPELREAIQLIMRDERTPAAGLAEVRNILQTRLDEMFN